MAPRTIEDDVDDVTGPPMLATTPSLRIKVGKVKFGKLRLSIRPLSLVGAVLGIISGLFFALPLSIIWSSIGAFIFPMVVGGAAGYGLSYIQPLPGEARRTWLLLRLRSIKNRVDHRGIGVEIYLGAAPLAWDPADVETLLVSAKFVAPGNYDTCGRYLHPQTRHARRLEELQ